MCFVCVWSVVLCCVVIQTEINYLGQLSHPNLVKLIGYCLEDEHRLLVYEFMQKGSLENHLFRSESHGSLIFDQIYALLFVVLVLMEMVLVQEVHILSHSHGFYGSRLRLMQQRGLLFFTAIPSKWYTETLKPRTSYLMRYVEKYIFKESDVFKVLYWWLCFP